MVHERTGALAALQRRLSQLVTAPEGVTALLEAEGDAEGRSLVTWLADDARLPAARRLDVYANAYFARIHDCLKEDYAALHAALDDDGFHDLVTAYLMLHPSRRPSLRFAGAALPDFLAADPAADPFRRRWPWASDLARLEWALVDAFDALDTEPLRRDDLAHVPAEHWPQLRLRLRPSVQLLSLAWPVHAMHRAWEQGRPVSGPAATRDVVVCIWRRSERVHFRALTPPEAELLEAVHAGAPFGVLCEQAEQTLGATTTPAFAAECLSRWVRDELLASER